MRSRAIVNRMNALLVHRGPDNQSVYQCEKTGLALGHTRLSILDLDKRSHQPMTSQSGRYSISYNGEIYNFVSLRTKLRSNGYVFRTTSDTEVLLELIDSVGVPAALKRLNGMFAFAVYDRKQQTIYLARDGNGEKGLYYSFINDAISFSSELRPIRDCHNITREHISRESLGLYLQYGFVPHPNTIFAGIKKLSPGECICISMATLAIESRTDLCCPEQGALDVAESDLSDRNLVDELDGHLNDAVSRALIADVKVGAFLSGGYDSTLVTAIAQKHSNEQLNTFTVAFSGTSNDESAHAKRVSEALGTQHHTLSVSDRGLLRAIDESVLFLDEPFANSSVVASKIMTQYAKQYVDVALAGDGGDEYFFGYNRYKYFSTADRYFRKNKFLGCFASSAAWTLNTMARASGRTDSLLSEAAIKFIKISAITGMDSASDIYQYLVTYWQTRILLADGAQHDPVCLPCFTKGREVEEAIRWDRKYYLPGDGLFKMDRMAMSESLEVRLPLLDKVVRDFASQIPSHIHLKNGISKQLLKSVTHRYVSKKLIDRPKRGFTVPVAKWLREELRSECDDLLGARYLGTQGLFDPAAVEGELRILFSGNNEPAHRIWALFLFQKWYNSI
ncbi:asparagine synthase (glutamine-hydrolyzing) [Reinekea sp.]|uniref:asparagine synthase (glutamine-hydrolyzing) n=1 Tax=Reinekea sp. TaxID=1970455 RepID=UPI002A82755A|nr:asparagine synthase (glutamine-hydrolyzing) [Reinekea sp.]